MTRGAGRVTGLLPRFDELLPGVVGSCSSLGIVVSVFAWCELLLDEVVVFGFGFWLSFV